ncbi:MAG: aminoglycoside phosphotransferase [Marmoricola sp.]|nr:aminoglycoside phosphotransferase [Marmoricola sp.]
MSSNPTSDSPAPLVSDVCRRTLLARGAPARRWLDQAPQVAEALRLQWALSPLEPMFGGHTGWVAATTRGGEPVVLKCVFDTHRFDHEHRAYRHLRRSGALPDLLAADPSRRALLLKRVLPGRPAQPSIGQLADAFERIHRVPAPSGTPLATEWVEGRQRVVLQTDRTSAEEHAFGASLWAELMAAPGEATTLLHGDAGPANLLTTAEDDVVWIDPEVMVGDPAADLAGWCVRTAAAGDMPVADSISYLHDLAVRCGASAAVALRWARVLAFDEFVSHRAYGLPSDVVARDQAILLGLLES